jgi:wyosine [tRNA(Phe)-imidazoG37] synthetase (radical SAM superfamily)
MKYKYIYGPIPSRRLGFSLGVDIIPFKNCSFNCIYCQVGKTTNVTITRQSYTPIDEILSEVRDILQQNVELDFITLSGAGEPTLHSQLGILLNKMRELTSKPIAVLTNASLIHQHDVRIDLQTASVVAPTLCTISQSLFRKINRSHPAVTIDLIINGLKQFRENYAGNIWLELMFVKGINDSEEEVTNLKGVVDKIRPDKIHINTVVRPPSEKYASPLSSQELENIKRMINSNAEVIASVDNKDAPRVEGEIPERILNILKRRPITIEDICAITGINQHELSYHMKLLVDGERVKITEHDGETYYEVNPTSGNSP